MKPLPQAIHKPNQFKNPVSTQKTSIVLGDNVIWNPANLPNGHVVLIGALGSGKTQTLKALAYKIPKFFQEVRIVLIKFQVVALQWHPGDRYLGNRWLHSVFGQFDAAPQPIQ
ncbi:MAG: hypothetical protein PUP91_39530, partial [Rhizonema sp. PD37]|nr:hypothetical protein [Rhizonema sp. PD37]